MLFAKVLCLARGILTFTSFHTKSRGQQGPEPLEDKGLGCANSRGGACLRVRSPVAASKQERERDTENPFLTPAERKKERGREVGKEETKRESAQGKKELFCRGAKEP